MKLYRRGLRGTSLQGSQIFRSRIVGIAIGFYLALVIFASFRFNISLTPDRVVVLLLIAALGTGRVRQFLKDWSVFLIILLAWQVLQGMSRHFGGFKPHVTEMIVADKALFFGQVPTIWLQHRLFHPEHLAWYDVAATVFYLLHFVFPIGVAFALWLWKRPIFLEFMVAFLLLGLSGFATFVLFPAAPPWLAADWHYLPPVPRILHPGIEFFGGEGSYSALYTWLWSHGGWDVVGAVPSEHAAFPFLCFLYARRAWKAGWLVLPYCFGVWVAVVYLGEHYVADVIVGVAYAAAAYAVVRFAAARRQETPHDFAESQTPAKHMSDSLPA